MTSWTPLSEADRLAWDKGRMGGGLLVMTIVTGFVTLSVLLSILAAMIVILRTAAFGLPLPDLSGPGGAVRTASLVFMIPYAFFAFWSVIVFIMTLVRARATPAFVCVLIGLQFLVGIASWIGGQAMIFAQYDSGPGALLVMIPSMIPAWLLQIVMIAGVCGYMLGGVRPNAYFKARVATPTSSARTAP